VSVLVSINPFNNEQLASYKVSSAAYLKKQIEQAALAQHQWKYSTINERVQLAKRIAKAILNNKKQLATMATLEMGKPINQAIMEVEKCAMIANYYADNLKETLAQPKPTQKINNAKAYTYYAPLGVVLSIMPWNFPYWQVFRNLIPIICGGNAYVLKHASNVYGCATLIAQVCKEAKVPEHLFQLLIAPASAMEALIAHPKVAAISFTGSTQVGKLIASTAGKHLKKCVLELGGNDGYGVLDDANVKIAVQACSYSRLINNGQSCLAAKRFIVHQNNYKAFRTLLLDKMGSISIGDPMDPNITLGPMARVDLRDELLLQVKKSVQKGSVKLNDRVVPKQGAFMAPLVLENIQKGMPAYSEEFFGPVSNLLKANSDDEVITLINDSSFGLGACIFTNNSKKAKQIVELELEAGNCFANDFVRSIPNQAFGGVKQSGYGRELGAYGVLEFMNIKSVYLS
jgi:succinate-semialdehyde dehydrogenase / glutarate-semialdehyde dehydrogenase